MSSTFDAVVRKSGNSLVVTIPKTTTDLHQIKNGTVLRVNVHLIDDQEEGSQ